MCSKVIRNFLIFILFISVSTSYACFENSPLGGRPAGMGNSFTALSDDLNSLYYNPAGLIQLKDKQILTIYEQSFIGLADQTNIGDAFIAYGQPLSILKGNIGMGWINTNVSNLYSEHTIYLSYATNLSNFPLLKIPLNLGISIKPILLSYAQKPYMAEDSIFSSFTKTNLSIDVGFLLNIGSFLQGVGLTSGSSIQKIMEGFQFGLSLFNLNQPDIGLKEKISLPATLRIGIGYKIEKISFKNNFSLKDLNILLDIETKEERTKLDTGIECWLLNNTLGIRAGTGFGSMDYNILTAGASYCFPSISFGSQTLTPQLDYAFLYMPNGAMSSTFGNHSISFLLKFGKEEKLIPVIKEKPEEEKTEESIEEEIKKLEEELKKLEKEK